MKSIEEWRNFFKESGTDIWSLIEYAILVAASDFPDEFRRRRERIAQTLYAPRFSDHDYVTLTEPGDEIIDDDTIQNCHGKDNAKMSSNTGETDTNGVINCSYGEAEALTEEIEEEESQVLKEVFRIKNILANPDESDSQLHNCLKRLELMKLTVETLQATEIGKEVNRFRKHNSKEIQSTVKRLISPWKELLDRWLKSSGLARHPVSSECKRYQDNMLQQPDLNRNRTKPDSFPLRNQKSKSSDDASVKVKLEASKRRLQEGYQQVENAKKQRKVKVIDFQDLPKQDHDRPHR